MNKATKRCFLIGACGRLGRLIAHRLTMTDWKIVVIGRNKHNLQAAFPHAQQILADLEHLPKGFLAELTHHDWVINAAHARFTAALLENLSPKVGQFLVLGSARIASKVPDPASEAVRMAAKQLETWPGCWTLIHPTMIYGAMGESNVSRITRILGICRVIPLPEGGRSLIQPVHAEDVAQAVIAALGDSRFQRRSFMLAGPEAMPFHQFITTIAAARGHHAYILRLPRRSCLVLAALTRILPGIPPVRSEEIHRLLEDKAFNCTETWKMLGIKPLSLAEGLSETFSK